jgi:hypothetical protein
VEVGQIVCTVCPALSCRFDGFHPSSGKFTFWQGGVRGIAFINSPLLPQSMVGGTWNGMMHAVDWYTTFADLAGASTDNTGPVPVDGYKMWSAISTNASSPRNEMVINIDKASTNGDAASVGSSKTSGFASIRMDQWKLIDGYPGNGKAAWDGWVPLPNASNPNDYIEHERAEVSDEAMLASPYITLADSTTTTGPRSTILFGNAAQPCSTSPCLFDVLAGTYWQLHRASYAERGER